MINDKWLKVRVPHQDLERWQDEARESGIGFSEWVRAAMDDFAKEVEVEVMPSAPIRPFTQRDMGKSAVAEGPPSRQKKTSGRFCVHGTAAGENCWQCGGKAKVGE